jgi:3-hydroxyacyl-CoA dehydrogenase/enoyl-CoA hydratase/3-hydroxybutyryl-CoA epimerase
MELIDEIGVDVGEKVAHILHDAFGERMLPAPMNGKVVAAGRLGKKNGKGMFAYDVQGKNKRLDPGIYEILGVSPKPGSLAPEEILERLRVEIGLEAEAC